MIIRFPLAFQIDLGQRLENERQERPGSEKEEERVLFGAESRALRFLLPIFSMGFFLASSHAHAYRAEAVQVLQLPAIVYNKIELRPSFLT